MRVMVYFSVQVSLCPFSISLELFPSALSDIFMERFDWEQLLVVKTDIIMRSRISIISNSFHIKLSLIFNKAPEKHCTCFNILLKVNFFNCFYFVIKTIQLFREFIVFVLLWLSFTVEVYDEVAWLLKI